MAAAAAAATMAGVPQGEGPPSCRLEFAVEMTCQNCVETIQTSLQGIPGLQVLDAQLDSQTVVVQTSLSTESVQGLLEITGRKVVLKGMGGAVPASAGGAAVAIVSGRELVKKKHKMGKKKKKSRKERHQSLPSTPRPARSPRPSSSLSPSSSVFRRRPSPESSNFGGRSSSESPSKTHRTAGSSSPLPPPRPLRHSPAPPPLQPRRRSLLRQESVSPTQRIPTTVLRTVTPPATIPSPLAPSQALQLDFFKVMLEMMFKSIGDQILPATTQAPQGGPVSTVSLPPSQDSAGTIAPGQGMDIAPPPSMASSTRSVEQPRPSWCGSDVQARIPPPSTDESESSSEEEEEEEDVVFVAEKTPDQIIGSVDPPRGEDQKSFTAMLIRLGTALSLQTDHPPLPLEDQVTAKLDRKAIRPVHIAMLPSLLSSAKAVWRKPLSSHTVSTRVDGLYRVLGDDVEFLHAHPLPNSMVVRACHSKTAVSGYPMPPSPEGKKLDVLGKKLYATASLSLRAANYSAVMGLYQSHLWERAKAFALKLPADLHAEFNALCDEGNCLSEQQMRTARNMNDAAAKNMSTSILLRRHAWLRSTELEEPTKKLIEDLPFDGQGLFAQDTDKVLKKLRQTKTTSKFYGLTSQSTSKPRYQPFSTCYQETSYQPPPRQQPEHQRVNFYRPRRQHGRQRYHPYQ